jgi:tRNA(fMet)-specific endonuclease VapC
MSGSVLLDTSIVIELFANNPAVMQNLAATSQIFLPSIVLGELYYGAFQSQKVKENTEQIVHFAAQNTILGCDDNTAQFYAFIKNNLRLKGKPIPENDIWIAAIAMQYSLALATRDNHFAEIDRLQILKW